MLYLTSGSREENPSFESKVSSVLSNLHSKRPRTFWGFIISKTFFRFSLEVERKFFKLCRNFETKSSKCILRVQRNTLTETLCWLCETISDFGRENVQFAAEDLQHCTKICTICLQMGNWKNSFEINFTFSDFFWTSREHFLVFSLNHFRNGRQNCFFQAKRNISIRKNILTKHIFHFRTRREFFLYFHWNIWGMVVKTTVYVFRRALWEGFRTMRYFF